MALETFERQLLTDATEAIGSMSLVLSAVISVLGQDVTNLKPRLLHALTTSSNDFSAIGDMERMLRHARTFIDSI